MDCKRMYKPLFFWVFIGSVCIVQAEHLTLTENGQTSYTIFTAETASESEEYAASELANFLNQVTEAEFKITWNLLPGANNIIAVGPDAARQVLPSI